MFSRNTKLTVAFTSFAHHSICNASKSGNKGRRRPPHDSDDSDFECGDFCLWFTVSVVIVGILAIIGYVVWKRKQRRREQEHGQQITQPPPARMEAPSAPVQAAVVQREGCVDETNSV